MIEGLNALLSAALVLLESLWVGPGTNKQNCRAASVCSQGQEPLFWKVDRGPEISQAIRSSIMSHGEGQMSERL